MKEHPFFFIGNHPALDFVNTLARPSGVLTDFLEDYEDLLRWLTEAGLADLATTATLQNAPDGEAVLAEALALRAELRESLPEITTEFAAKIDRLLDASAYAEHFEIHAGKPTLDRRWAPRSARDILALLAYQAANLFATVDRSLLRQCEGPTCILWFLDTTKNRGRRWCSMAVCGNRHKAAGHYLRSKGDS